MLRRGQIAGNRARTIADIEAQAAMARGQILGGTVAGIAGSVGDIISGYARQQAEAPARALEHATKAADLRLKETQIAEAGQKADERDRLTRRETAWMGLLEMEGLSPDVLQRETLRIYGPKDAATMLGGLKAFADLKTGRVTDAKQTTLGLTAAWKKASPALRAQFWPGLREAVVTGGLLPAESTPEAPPDDAFISAVEAWARGKEPETPNLMNVPPGGAVLDPVTQQPVFTNPREIQPSNPTEASLAAAAAAGDKNAAEALRLLRAQRPAPQGPVPSYSWAKDPKTGEVVRATEEEIRARGLKQPDTADMRNKEAGKKTAALAVKAVRDLGSTIITKVGPSQRIDAIARGAEAIWGTDPEFRTYQDSRMALAGTLAVEQQGSRVSDADVKALWLPMVPDAYRDTAESYKLKWDLIDAMRGVEGKASSEADDAYSAYLKRQGAGRAR